MLMKSHNLQRKKQFLFESKQVLLIDRIERAPSDCFIRLSSGIAPFSRMSELLSGRMLQMSLQFPKQANSVGLSYEYYPNG